MPSDEGKQVLQLLAEGKIDVEQAYRLLRALGDVEEGTTRPPRPPFAPFPPTPPTPPMPPPGSGGRGRILRIRVTEDGEQKVNVAIPLLIPTSGTIRVLGIDPLTRPREVRARLGAMLSGERSLYWKLTGRENLEYFAALYHVPPGETKARIANVLAAVKLADRADDYVS